MDYKQIIHRVIYNIRLYIIYMGLILMGYGLALTKPIDTPLLPDKIIIYGAYMVIIGSFAHTYYSLAIRLYNYLNKKVLS